MPKYVCTVNARIHTIKEITDTIEIDAPDEVQAEEDVQKVEEQRRQADNVPKHFEHKEASATPEEKSDKVRTEMRNGPKVGRNDTCPCGSGKKYKQCHGKLS